MECWFSDLIDSNSCEALPRCAPSLNSNHHVRYGFEFLGYKIKSGWRKLHLPESKIRSQARQGALYAYPKEKSIRRFMDQVRQRTKRLMSLRTPELIAELNPLLRGWGEYYKRAQVRKLFQRLDGWIRRRIWSHRYRRWRNPGWKQLPAATLYGEYKLVRLIDLNLLLHLGVAESS
jgi:RNA-directed DNA polymerase